jgi:uncharacterized paraquat-inducible protein A
LIPEQRVIMSNIGKIAKCSVCGKEKPIVYEKFSESLQQESHYCKECYNYSKDKIRCGHCGEKVNREFLPEHLNKHA